jgi:hypothetical protein
MTWPVQASRTHFGLRSMQYRLPCGSLGLLNAENMMTVYIKDGTHLSSLTFTLLGPRDKLSSTFLLTETVRLTRPSCLCQLPLRFLRRPR